VPTAPGAISSEPAICTTPALTCGDGDHEWLQQTPQNGNSSHIDTILTM
jgi:hypothetical protein